jgi:ABC-type branched-subunit amino acid transport system substrate-binding protein
MQRRNLLAAAVGGISFAASPMSSRAQAAVASGASNEIVLGQSAIISGPLGGPIQAMISGAQLAFDAVNAQGGVHGRKIRLLTLDDELAPPKAVANYKKLLEEQGVVAMFGCVGSGTTAAAGKLLPDYGCASIGGYGVADSAREKTGNHGFFLRASMGREAEVLVQQLTTIGITQFAVAHMDNPGGQEALALVTQALQARQLSSAGNSRLPGRRR